MAEEYSQEIKKIYEDELKSILSTPVTRCFIMRFLVEDLGIFAPGVVYNAQIYGAAAKRDAGLKLYNYLKYLDAEKVFLAEKEYRDLKIRENNIRERINKNERGETLYE